VYGECGEEKDNHRWRSSLLLLLEGARAFRKVRARVLPIKTNHTVHTHTPHAQDYEGIKKKQTDFINSHSIMI